MSSTVANGNTEDVQQRLLNERATLSPRRNPMAAMLKSKTGKANTNTGGEQCDEEKSRLQGEIDSLRAEVKDLKEKAETKETTKDALQDNKPSPPRMCCRAMTKACLACSKGVSVEEFCKTNGGKFGCPRKLIKPSPPPRMCCMAMTANCIACSRGVSVEELCKDAENRVPGCPKPITTKPDDDDGKKEKTQKEEEEEVKCDTKQEKCCKSQFSPKCMACRTRNRVNLLKAQLCEKTKGEKPAGEKDDDDKADEHDDENPDDNEDADPSLEEPEKPKRPSKFDGPCMFEGKEDKDAPFCHDYDRMWGMPSDYNPDTKERDFSLLQTSEKVGEAKDIKWVVDLVKKIETAYPYDNWKTLATRLRKIVYFGKLWDMLIPKAKKTGVLAVKGECTQEVINSLTTPNLNVRDPTGQQIDLNHVWVGIDVANFPATNLLVRIFGGLKGPAVATWAGDVGSVLGEFYYKTQGEGDINRYYEIMSGDDDMYSNADGYGIALQKLPSGSRNWKLSQRIEHYYQTNIHKRVTYMMDASGLAFKKKGRKKGQLTWNAKRKIRAQIRRFAKLWRIHQCPHGWKKCLIPTSKDPLHQKPKTVHTAKMGKTYLKSERDYVIDKFIKWVEDHLKKEI